MIDFQKRRRTFGNTDLPTEDSSTDVLLRLVVVEGVFIMACLETLNCDSNDKMILLMVLEIPTLLLEITVEFNLFQQNMVILNLYM